MQITQNQTWALIICNNIFRWCIQVCYNIIQLQGHIWDGNDQPWTDVQCLGACSPESIRDPSRWTLLQSSPHLVHPSAQAWMDLPPSSALDQPSSGPVRKQRSTKIRRVTSRGGNGEVRYLSYWQFRWVGPWRRNVLWCLQILVVQSPASCGDLLLTTSAAGPEQWVQS